jgi:hypothetical protein
MFLSAVHVVIIAFVVIVVIVIMVIAIVVVILVLVVVIVVVDVLAIAIVIVLVVVVVILIVVIVVVNIVVDLVIIIGIVVAGQDGIAKTESCFGGAKKENCFSRQHHHTRQKLLTQKTVSVPAMPKWKTVSDHKSTKRKPDLGIVPITVLTNVYSLCIPTYV